MTFGIAAIILLYLIHRFPWIAVVGALLCLILLGGLLTIVWRISYPDNLWYFWTLVGIGLGSGFFFWLFGKVLDDLL